MAPLASPGRAAAAALASPGRAVAAANRAAAPAGARRRRWMDILGPFSRAIGGYRFLFVAIDKFTKCPVATYMEYCEGIGTQLCFASLTHPRSNEQVESANVEILTGLKTHTYDCLKKHGASWVNELPCVLWGNWTIPTRATRETRSFWFTGSKPAFP
eukprot:XP_020397193.1 uncharacterized protein LOC109941111 [Zea mays]